MLISSELPLIQPKPLLREQIQIWMIDIQTFSPYINHFYKLLSPMECQRAAQYKFECNRNIFIIARGILRNFLSFYAEIRTEAINFFYNKYGKPFLKARQNKNSLQFNVSHSGNFVFYIFSKGCHVGIDIEKIRWLDNFEDIAKQFFSPAERKTLGSLFGYDKLRAFFKGWSCREAFGKAMGKGLSQPLPEIEISLLPVPTLVLNTIKGNPLIANWSLLSWTPCTGYEAAVVFEGHDKDIIFHEIKPSTSEVRSLIASSLS